MPHQWSSELTTGMCKSAVYVILLEVIRPRYVDTTTVADQVRWLCLAPAWCQKSELWAFLPLGLQNGCDKSRSVNSTELVRHINEKRDQSLSAKIIMRTQVTLLSLCLLVPVKGLKA